MRCSVRFVVPFLVVASCSGIASAANAFAIRYEVRGGQLSSYGVSDAVVVDVFLGAPDPGITSFSASIRVDAAILGYDPVGSAALPVIHPAPGYGTTGAAPGYILYGSSGMSGEPATVLYPLANPWPPWPSPPPGQTQVNIDYREPNLGETSATDTNVWIASLLFHVDADFDTTTISLDVGQFMIQGDTDVSGAVDVFAPIVLSGHVPEPGTVVLLGLGLFVSAAARRGSARRPKERPLRP